MKKKEAQRLTELLQDDMLGEEYKAVIREILGIKPEFTPLVWDWETYGCNSWSADGATGIVYSIKVNPDTRKFNAWGERGDEFPTRTFATFKEAADYCTGIEQSKCVTKAPQKATAAGGSKPKRRDPAKGR